MQPGTVIKWDDFPYPQYGGKLKPRWLICLGCTNCFSDPVLHYFHSTTRTQRRGEPRFNLRCEKYPFFTEDCFLYFNENPYHIAEHELKISKVSVVGHIEKIDLKVIYGGLIKSINYSRKQVLDIHYSLNKIGITGLKNR
jgi:hypothetical protein